MPGKYGLMANLAATTSH